MYALIQMRSQPTHRARIIAANNILNALFMIGSSLIAGALLGAGFTVPQIFLFTGLANAVVAFYIFMLVPEYLLRFVAWVSSRFVYRFRVQGDENLPSTGAAILACNHVSFVDAVLLMAASPRPIYFVMDHRHLPRSCAGLAVPPGQRPSRLRRTRKTRRPTKQPLTARPRCCAKAICWPSSPRGASPRTGSCRSSRAAS